MAQKQTAGRDRLGKLAPQFAALNDDVLFGEVWAREEQLSARDRSMITIAALFSAGLYPPAEIPPDPGQGPRHYETGSHRDRHTVGVLLRMAQSVEHLPHDRGSMAG